MDGRSSRRAFLAATGISMVAGCVGSGVGGETAGSGPPTVDRSLPMEYRLDTLRDERLSGTPSPDGIPSIDDPDFRAGADLEADGRLGDIDIVFGVAVDDVVPKAYPQFVLVWHEIVNDVIDDTPVSVTYCPLTGTAQGFVRGTTTFGVSGQLLNSNLVMFDRDTESLWSQMLATAIDGPMAGSVLDEFRLVWTTWGNWKESHPDSLVLTTETGFARDYGDDPYGTHNARGWYYARDGTLFPPLHEDGRYHPKKIFYGVRNADGTVAFDKSRLEGERLAEVEVDDVAYVAVYDTGLETVHAYRNPHGLAFEFRNGRVTDRDGHTYEPDELPIEPVLGWDVMWFAWIGFYPSSVVW